MKNWNKLLMVGVIVTSSQAMASPFGNWGGNKWGGSGFGGGCNDWPEWTPMYWMEKMIGSDIDCDSYYPRSSAVPYGGYGYPAVNNIAYANPYGVRGGYGRYGQQRPPVNAYSAYGNPYAAYTNRRYVGNRYGNSMAMPMMNRGQWASPYGRGFSGFPGLGQGFGQGFSPFSGRSGGFPSMSSFGSGFNPMGGGGLSPMGFGSPMSPMSFGAPMSPMGFGSPMSPMSPMGFGSPMSSMNPMGGGFGGGSSPFGMKRMNPFSGGGMGSPFSF